MFRSLEELFEPEGEEMRLSVTIFGFAKRPPMLDTSGRYYIAPPIEKVWLGTQRDGNVYVSVCEVVLREETTEKEAERMLRRILSRGEGVTLDFAKTYAGLVVLI